jgi:hypothetical protein
MPDPEAHIIAHASQLGRACGRCSLCCKVIGVSAIGKSAGKWCPLAVPGQGCGVYSDRPVMCRAFACRWLADASFGDEWYPARAKMVVTIQPVGQPVGSGLAIYVDVDESYPDAWRRAPYYAQLRARAAGRFTVVVRCGARRYAVLPAGEVALG